MSTTIKGMQELIDQLDKMGNSKVPKKALRKASKYVLEVEQETAEQTHDEYSKKVGYKHLRAFPPRMYKGAGFVDVGMKGKKGDWELVKGLYFNHYGFHHNGWHSENNRENRIKKGKSSGKYVAGSRWMDNAFDKSAEHAYELLVEGLLEGVDLK